MDSKTIDQLKAEFKRLGYQWPNFHLIGIRSNADVPDAYDDDFYLINGTDVHKYTGTTNPGAYWLQNFFNPAFGGTALLAPGQYVDTWQLGVIYGEEGFRQSKPVKIFRDSNKNLKSEEMGIPQIGMYSIHIHKMFKNTKSLKIWNWSAGCQGLNDPTHWNDLMDRFKKANLPALTYTLLKEF